MGLSGTRDMNLFSETVLNPKMKITLIYLRKSEMPILGLKRKMDENMSFNMCKKEKN